MNPVEFHPFEMQFEVPGTDGQTVYTRRFQAPRRLIILGCGYVAQSLCRFASQLEFDIYAADDRPSFANPYTMTNAKKVICDSFPAAIEQIHLMSRISLPLLHVGTNMMRIVSAPFMPVASHLLIWGLSVRKDVLPDFLKISAQRGLTALFSIRSIRRSV